MPGRPWRRPRGQHFLASDELAAAIVGRAGVGRHDLVVEPGAGTGRLTRALARTAGQVWAIEADAALERSLSREMAGERHVMVSGGDFLSHPLPARPFRVLGNIPFQHTAALLHGLLDDPRLPLERADLIVQWQVARALERAAETVPSDLRASTWAPWWRFRRDRRLPPSLFRPPPPVAAAVLVISRRRPALLPASSFPAYRAYVSRVYERDASARRVPAVEWAGRFTGSRPARAH